MAFEFKRPNNWNLGGIWVFNPPEGSASTTDLRGAGLPSPLEYFEPRPVGRNFIAPAVWHLQLEGTKGDSGEAEFLGQHYLERRYYSQDALRDLSGDPRLGYWLTDDIEERYPFTGPLWTLTWGTLRLTRGPYSDYIDLRPNWWLLGLYGEHASGPGYGAEYLYQFYGPGRDPGAVVTVSEDNRWTSWALFDQQGPNVFKYVPSSGELIDSPGGAVNEYVTVSPFWI